MIQAHEVVQAVNLETGYALERLNDVLQPMPQGRDAAREVWFYGPYVLRIHGGLANEARLLRTLPTSIPHAPVVAAGDNWIVQQRVAGERLSVVWRSLGEAKRRAAVQQLAAILINLHQVRVTGMPSLSPGWFPAILPAEIVDLATRLREREPALFDAVIDVTRQTLTAITPPLRWGFVHRNLHFDHVLWNGERITALLDFETAVLAPRELELDMIRRFIQHPSLYSPLEPDDLAMLPHWLKEDYPLLFGEAGIERRLPLYSIEHDLRQLAAEADETALERLRATIGS